MTDKKKDPRREAQKYKRDLMRKAMGVGEESSTNQRVYGEATKTRRAVKAEIFGNKSKMMDTKPELFVEEILKEVGIEYKKQKAIRYINVDFFIPSKKLVIAVNGTYWHCCPVCYPAGPKNNIQKLNLEKDKVSKEVVASMKYDYLEIWECEDVQKAPEEAKKKILEALK